MATLTIFTPTYNRSHTLGETYASLLRQDVKDFIWLIIDDGSSDGTKELVESWLKNDNGFEIKYVRKENGGMHTAHNAAYELIDTPLNMCIDSDDRLADSAVRLILEKWSAVDREKYAGIIALDSDLNGNIIGTPFPEDMTHTTLSGFYAAGGSGDKKLIYRTDVIKSVPPYPVFEGEKYVALAYKYRLIDQKYELCVLNETVCLVDYQADGSSNSMLSQYVKNPKGFAFWRKICMQYPQSKKRTVIDCVHYVSSSIIAKNKGFISESPKKLLTAAVLPLGAALTAYIKLKLKKQDKK